MNTDILNKFIINNKSNQAELNTILDHYLRLKVLKICSINNFMDDCSGPIIKAHSISKSSILKNISYDINDKQVLGYFKKTNPLHLIPLFHRIREKYIDVNSALTFTGLCKYHDNFLFKNIDKDPFNFNNPQIFFEYTLRNCIYSYYNRLSNEKGVYESNKFLESKLFNFSHKENLPLSSIVNEKNIILKDLEKLCNNINSDNNHKNILYKLIQYEGNINIAGCLYFVYKKEVFYITLLPGIRNSYILISAVKGSHILQKSSFFQLIRSMNKSDFEILISELLLQATETNSYVFNYNRFQSLDESTKNKIYNWLDYENMDKIYENTVRYDALGNIPNLIQLMLDSE